VLAQLKKRLTSKKHAVGLVAVQLLEALVKNCPTIVPMVAAPEFMDEFVHTLPRQVRDPHNRGFLSGFRDGARDILAVERWDKSLLAIQSWALAFPADSESVRRDRRLLAFSETLRSLQRAGVKFPAPERDELAPVVTPEKNRQVADHKAAEQRRQLEELAAAERQRQGAAQAQQAQAQAQAAAVFHFTDDTCRTAADTSALLTDLLTQSGEREDLRRNDLVQQILEALKPVAAKIAQRLGAEANAARPNEGLLAQLLQANELLVDATGYYEGLVSGKMKRRVAAPAQPAPSQPRASLSASSSPAPSPMASPAGAAGMPPRKTSLEKKHVSVPRLEPPPASVSGGSSSRQRNSPASQASVSSGAAASPASARPSAVPVASPASQSLLDLDLLFSSPAAAPSAHPAQPNPHGVQQPQSSFFDMHRQHQPPPPVSASAAAVAPPPQIVSPPAYEQQERLVRQANQQLYAQKPHLAPAPGAAPARSPFALEPPPSAGPAADFFASASATVGHSKPRPAPAPAASAGAARAPAPVMSTPFDSPDPPAPAVDVASDDPWTALATRTSPHALPPKSSPSSLDDFANLKF
jgi:hypothetical protein